MRAFEAPGPGRSSFAAMCFMEAPNTGQLEKGGLRGEPAQAAAGPSKNTARARAARKTRAGGPLPASLPSRLLHAASENAAFSDAGRKPPAARPAG